MVGPLPEEPRVSYYTLAGSEDDAASLLERELERMMQELDEEFRKGPQQTEAKIFTLYVMPEGGPTAREGEWVPVHLPWANPERLAEMVWAEVESVYCDAGLHRVDQLLDSVSRSGRSQVLGRTVAGGVPLRWFGGNAVPFEEGEAFKAAEAVQVAFDAAAKELDARIKRALERLQPTAETEAVGRMKVAREEIEAERARYVDEEAVARVGGGYTALSGPGVHGLLDALRDVHRIRRRLDEATAAYDQRMKDVAGSLPQGTQFPDGPVGLAELVRQAHPDATAELLAATEALVMAVSVYGRRFPVLHRVWNGPAIPDEVVPHAGDQHLDFVTGAGWDAIDDLFTRIRKALEETQKANGEVVARLESDPEDVWQFPPAVSAALDKWGFGYPSIEARAAQDRASEALAATPAGARVYAVVNGVDAVAWVMAASPPVLIGLAVLTFVAGVASNIEEYVRLARQETAFKAVLDPGKALCVEPDYSGLLVGVLFSLLDLNGVRVAARAAKEVHDVTFLQGVFTAVAVEHSVVAMVGP